MREQPCFEVQLGGAEEMVAEKSCHLEAQNHDEKRNLLLHATSDLGAFLHVLKGSLGAGILAMPFAFKNGGLLFGVIGSLIVGVIITHTTAMLIDCSQNLSEIYGTRCMSFADTAEYAFKHGLKGKLKDHAHLARYFVNFFLFITYYGGSAYYVLLIASTIKQVVDKQTGVETDVRIFTAALFFLLYPIGIIKVIKYLVPFSAIANFFLILALGLIFFEIFRDLPSLSSRPAVAPVSQWPIFISMVFAGMEGIGTIMPVENEMANPRNLTNGPRILYSGMAMVGLLTTAVGFFGYLKYGEKVTGAISLNLPDDWLSGAVKVMIALVILFSFGLQMTVSTEVIWSGLLKIGKLKEWHYYAIRSSLIFGSVLLAIALPSLGGVVGLVGSIGFSTLGIFCPAVIESVFYNGSEHTGYIDWRLLKNVLLIMFAVGCGSVGAYSSIKELGNS